MKMNQIIRVFGSVLTSIIIMAILSGSAVTGATLNTTTGKPEVIINGVSKEAVLNAIAGEMLLNNYSLKSRSKTSDTALFATRGRHKVMSVYMEVRVTYNLIDIPGGTRVMATILEYDDPGTNKETLWKDHSSGGTWANNIQSILNSVKPKLEQKPTTNVPQEMPQKKQPAKIAAKKEERRTLEEPRVLEERRILVDMVGMVIVGKNIVSIIADGPADKAGVNKGDLIIMIDGDPAGTGEENASRLTGTGKADTSVVLRIKRGNQEYVIPVIRENP